MSSAGLCELALARLLPVPITLPDGVVAIDIVRVPPSRLNTLASQAAQTLISPASQVSRSQNRKTGVQLKRIIWGLLRSGQNPNPATPGGERYLFSSI